VRLDAFENYIRGITAPTHQEQIRRLKEAVRLSPEFERAMYQLGHADYESRDYQDAVTWLTKLHHDTADAREGMFYAALAAYSQGDYAHAEEWFGQLAARMPLTEVLNDLAVAQARLGKNTALQSFQRAVQADPNDPDYRYNYAVALYRSGDSGAAARQLREALVLKPNDTDAKSLLDAVSSGAQPAKAPAERIKRNYDETAFRLAELEVERETEARLATADPATHARYHLERGRELFNEGLAAEAEKHFREACQLDPQNAAAHAALASVLEREGDVKNARTEAEAATSSSPSAEAYIVLTRLDMRAGDLTAAAMDVERALTLQPGNTAAQMLDREIKARRVASQKSEQN
ncbi:MAG TPA: tetratricopeptide repeat protein, partial [Terriglobales bacterium]|nr:tetratricopeptide repeat protein [Terriglobales bacterium]